MVQLFKWSGFSPRQFDSIQTTVERTTQMSSANATLLGGMEWFSCIEINHAALAALAAIRARGWPTVSTSTDTA